MTGDAGQDIPDTEGAAGPARRLAADRAGSGSGVGARLVLVHGFTQTGRCWGPVADDLSRDHELVLIDAPGHGRSSTVRATLEDGAHLIGEAGGRGTYIGYSMGGRFTLRLALDRPDRVERLVLIGASPGIESSAERARRRRADRGLAHRIERIGVATFLDEWLAQPLFAGLSPAMQFRAERLENDAASLGSSLRLAGTGSQESLWDRLHELEVPVLLVSGADDAKFRATASRMADAIGGSRVTVVAIPGAGHTAHLEAPDAFLAELRTWLDTA
jgi:2-succinyl-6-hydroxy-2,4-cyclohexadiene-1-carboxylate synthase